VRLNAWSERQVSDRLSGRLVTSSATCGQFESGRFGVKIGTSGISDCDCPGRASRLSFGRCRHFNPYGFCVGVKFDEIRHGPILIGKGRVVMGAFQGSAPIEHSLVAFDFGTIRSMQQRRSAPATHSRNGFHVRCAGEFLGDRILMFCLD